MNARQKAKLYKKQRDYLYNALLNSVYENHKIGDEIQKSVIDIHSERRFKPDVQLLESLTGDFIHADLIKTLINSEEFKRSLAFEKYVDPITNETVYTAHMQTIKPIMEEE